MSMAEQNEATNPPQVPNYPPTSAYPARRSYKRWIFVASFVVLAVAGAFLFHYLSGFESTAGNTARAKRTSGQRRRS